MANNVIGLFENEAVADRVVEELVANGFNSSSIKRFKGNNAQLEDELRSEGIPADEASYYVNGLSEGGALVSVRAEESETDNAVEIMNRFVAPEGSSAPAEPGTTQDADAGWAEAGSSGYEAADTAAARAGGSGVGRAAYESYNQQKLSSWDVPARQTGDAASDPAPGGEASPAAPTGPGFPVGREAYAAYQRNRPAPQETQGSSASEAAAPAGPGFPVGREAYEAYSRDKTARGDSQAGDSSDVWNDAPADDSETHSSTGFTVGREAYEAYSREKAAGRGQND